MSENDTLEKYEMILEDYYALLEDQSNMADADEHFDDQNEYYYEKNDAYEGDLHATLGALYLARGDIGTAQSSFLRAAELYESAGEGGNQASAEVQFNLATTSFQNREYDASIAYHYRGVAIYRSLVVEGDSPMVDGLYNVEFVEGVPEPVKESKAKERTVEHRPKKDDKAKPNQPIIHIDVNQYARQMLLNASSSKEEL
jgi:tetratricopeptide (TPR) repeat protein